MKDLDVNFLEVCMIKTLLEDKNYLVTLSSTFEEKYFQNKEAGEIFTFIKSHLEEFKEIPSKEIICSSVKNKESVLKFLDKTSQLDYDVCKNYDWLLEKSNEYLKETSIKAAILSSVEIIKANEDLSMINGIIEGALCKDLKIDLGQSYFDDYKERLIRIAQSKQEVVPSCFPILDELINGGFPPKTFSVIIGKIGFGKTLFLCNMAMRQVMAGYTPVIFTLEMSEDAYSQRFDSILSLMDINRLYINNKNIGDLAKKITKERDKDGRGSLIIKEFPTGKATFNDYRIFLRELRMRGIKPSIGLIDYLGLMATPSYKGDNLYIRTKYLAEEGRSFAFENNIPLVSVSQFQREGLNMDITELDFDRIAEGIVLAATADFIALLGNNAEDMIYNSEVWWKIVKNRLGGRVGYMDKFYKDDKSLKFYCSTELDKWLEDSKITGDERTIKVA